MSKRLVKVAEELNVGTKTIVEFLNSNGFQMSNKPTAKVSAEMYSLLAKNFQKSIAIKEKANKITIGTRKKEEKPKANPKPRGQRTLANKESENSSLEKKTTTDKPVEKTVAASAKDEKATPEDLANQQRESAKPSSKINLDDSSSKTLPLKNTSLKKSESRDVKDKKRKEIRKKTVSKVEVNKEAPQPKTDKVELPPKRTERKPKSKAQQLKNREPKSVTNKKSLKTKVSTPKTNISKEQGQSPAKKNNKATEKGKDAEEVNLKVKAPQLKGLKILGKINVERKNRRKRRSRSSEEKNTPQAKTSSNRYRNLNRGDDNRQRNRESRRPNPSDNRDKQNNPQGQGSRANQNNYSRSSQNQGARKSEGAKHPQKRSDYKRNRTSTNPKKEHITNKSATSGTPKTSNTSGSTNNRKPPINRSRRNDKVHRGSRDHNSKRKNKAISTKDVNDKLRATMAKLSGGAKRNRNTRRQRDEKKLRQRQLNITEEKKPLQVTEFVSVSELAGLMDVPPTEIIMLCMKEQIYVSINQRLDVEVIELVASEFGHEVEFISAESQIAGIGEEEEINEAALVPRAPIVTVMGHVDHGKTSLLDRIRKTNVVDGEAGGITQHIGAYEVRVADPEDENKKKSITFLDTPGHEAFTAMRARGAKVTDVAVIIIAADDSVMPQTKEAISHAQAAGVPIVFAINKIDKDGANPDRIKEELSRMNLLIEDWGGSYQSQDISAKHGLNIESLLEKILLEAEMLTLKADPTTTATGTVLEASMERGRGYVTKILVQNGTLSVGDTLVAGYHYGKIRAMFNERGQLVKKVGPSTPVLILGMQGGSQAGEKFKVMPSEKEAKALANKRAQIVRQQQIRATRRITLGDITARLKVGNFQELKLIVKGDMDGSVEALADSLLKLKTEQIQTTVVHKAVGQITESDVNLAVASNAIIIGFQVRPNPMAKKLAEQEGIEIKIYSVIYDSIEEIKLALEGMLEPKQVEEQVALLDVLQVFKISKVGTVAGCLVREGKVSRHDFVRVIRNGIVVHPKKEGAHGKLGSLKRFKDDVAEVKFGTECGLTVEGYDYLKEGDALEIYQLKEVKQKLNLDNANV